MSKELQEVNQGAMLALVEKVALDPNVDTNKMQQIIDMQMQVFDKNAQIEFNKSMVKCQKEMPIIKADTKNNHTKSLYSKYSGILKIIQPIYTKHGFSLSFDEGQPTKDKHVKVICEVMHKSGFTKVKTMELPLDMCGIQGSVNKTGIHAAASAHSYAKRYLAKMIFNIVEGDTDDDDDGIAAGGITIELLLNNNAAVRNLFPSISAIKMGILMNTNESLTEASNAFWELTQEERISINLAPTKGGIFTIEENKILSSCEFRYLTYPKKGN